MSSFEYTDEDGGRLTAKPLPGVPYVLLTTTPGGAAIPLDRLEEVIAGQRDMARQAGGQAPEETPVRTLPGRREFQAWIRQAVAGAPITSEQLDQAREVLPEGAVVTAAAVRQAEEALCGHCGIPMTSHHHPWTSTSDAIANDPRNTSKQPEPNLTVTERQFLGFALDLAFDRMASRGDEFTDEDHAALDRFRSMTVGAET